MDKQREVFSPFGKMLISMIIYPFLAGLLLCVIHWDKDAGGLGFLFSFLFFILGIPILLIEYFEYKEKAKN